jgi:hypothetical protein
MLHFCVLLLLDDICLFFPDVPRFCKPVAQDDVHFFFAMLRLSPSYVVVITLIGRYQGLILFLACRHHSTHWMAGHNGLYKKQQRPTYQVATIENNSNPALSSFVGVVQSSGWQGTASYTKERKENDQGVTIDTNSNPILLSFCRRRSTWRMTGHDVYNKKTKENDQTATINKNSKARATININNLPSPMLSISLLNI